VGVLVFSCSNKDRPQKPDNLIPKSKMSQILFDLYIINGAKGVNRQVFEKRNLKPESYLLAKHKIDSAQFADSNSYWAFDTESYTYIIEEVKSKLESKKKELENLQKIEQSNAKRKRDSLKGLNKSKLKVTDNKNKSKKKQV